MVEGPSARGLDPAKAGLARLLRPKTLSNSCCFPYPVSRAGRPIRKWWVSPADFCNEVLVMISHAWVRVKRLSSQKGGKVLQITGPWSATKDRCARKSLAPSTAPVHRPDEI